MIFFQYWQGLRIHRFGIAALLLCLVLVGAGCGKKGWPKPTGEGGAKEFKWSSVLGSIQDDCLVVAASLDGDWQSVEAIVLELADPEECLGCPFNPVKGVGLSKTDAGFVLKGPGFTMRYCPDADDRQPLYRWRLVGRSQDRTVGDVPSKVRVTR